jgi:hypothetical protein
VRANGKFYLLVGRAEKMPISDIGIWAEEPIVADGNGGGRGANDQV